jgi:glutathione peroxidase-family protein
MVGKCAASCERAAAHALKDSKELQGIHSFFELSAKDILGNVVEFSQFQGQVTVLVNVASYCGYTDSHYRGLVKLWSQVKHTSQINILAFPCNQFGAQEPDTNENIDLFALGYGVEFTMMDKVDVNGANASIVYKYLKQQAGGPANIAWNFATYFVVAPDGSVEAHSGVEPMELKDIAMGLMESDEL